MEQIPEQKFDYIVVLDFGKINVKEDPREL
jgi:hypothetical protein